jgi:hypothetical protein
MEARTRSHKNDIDLRVLLDAVAPTDSAGGPPAIEKKAPPIDAASCLGQSRAGQNEVGEAPT